MVTNLENLILKTMVLQNFSLVSPVITNCERVQKGSNGANAMPLNIHSRFLKMIKNTYHLKCIALLWESRMPIVRDTGSILSRVVIISIKPHIKRRPNCSEIDKWRPASARNERRTSLQRVNLKVSRTMEALGDLSCELLHLSVFSIPSR